MLVAFLLSPIIPSNTSHIESEGPATDSSIEFTLLLDSDTKAASTTGSAETEGSRPSGGGVAVVNETAHL